MREIGVVLMGWAMLSKSLIQFSVDGQGNRMGKTRDLFKKIRHTKGTFHAKMGKLKDKNDMGLIEVEDIKRGARIHRRTTKKIFITQITMMV